MPSATPERELYAALSAPLSSINATVTQRLHALRPRAHVSYTELWGFDVDTYCFDGHATRTPRADVTPVFRLIYDETQTKLEEDVRHGWFDVQWQGHALEVVSLSVERQLQSQRLRGSSFVRATTGSMVEIIVV